MAISSGKKIEGDETVHRVSARQRKKGPKTSNMQPPLTPMIDVTFQLLLFFLLTCEFRESEGNIPGTLPAKGSVMMQVTNTPPPDPIRIRIRPSVNRASASYEVTGVAVVINNPTDLYAFLKNRQEQVGSDEVPIIILPSADVPWEFVVQAFNQAVQAKYKKIGFAQEIM